MEICGLIIPLTQIGLILGILGAIVLALSVKVGTISKDGQIIFNGLDPMLRAEQNKKKVLKAHWRNRYITPFGWFLLATSFDLQFIATF